MIKCYALLIDTTEAYESMNSKEGKKLIQAVKKNPDFVGINQPDVMHNMLLFKTEKARNKAVKELHDIGFLSAKSVSSVAYVDEKYLKG